MAAPLNADENPYEVLGLGLGGASLSELEIKKAYRRRAIVLHPDKRPAAERAAAETEFNALAKAYELLCDAAARAAWDNFAAARNARLERDKGLDERRKRMRADLEAKEKEHSSRRSDEEVARARLKQEIERLRAAAAEKAARGAGGNERAEAEARVDPAAEEQLRRTLKVAWERAAGDYSAAELRSSFTAFGGVEDVVLRDGGSGAAARAKGSALVVMLTAAAASAAAAAACGTATRPLLVVPAVAPPPPSTARTGGGFGTRMPSPPPPAAPLFGGLGRGGGVAFGGLSMPSFSFSAGAAAGAGGVRNDYEAATLHAMRSAAERQRRLAAAARGELDEEE